MDLSKLSKADKIKLIKLLQRKKQMEKERWIFEDFQAYDYQRQFMKAGLKHKQRMLCAANQIGKTSGTGAPELIYHLTGIYPDWWEGYKFDRPIKAWALGVTGEQIRDVLQSIIFGKLDRGATNFSGTGLLPACLVRSITRADGTPNLAKDISIEHLSGGTSTLSFKMYSQGQQKLMGSVIDFILIDEEPTDPLIYPQCLTRLMNGGMNGEGGLMVLTFTPENGYTDIIKQYMEDLRPGQYFQNATWDDAPHLTDARKKEILNSYPSYQRDMRSRGIPLMGEGAIYPIDEELIKYDPFPIPAHWPRLAGIDFGMDHPEAVVWIAYDPDTDCAYVYHAFKENKNTMGNSIGPTPQTMAPIFRGQGDWIPVAWPHDGYKHEKAGDGLTVAEMYRKEGVNMMYENATYPSVDGTGKGSNLVEPGLFDILDRMNTGRLKVARHLGKWFEEMRIYHRVMNHKTHAITINKKHDDLMDATRYAIMMLRHAEVKPNPNWQAYANTLHGAGDCDNSAGY